MVLTLADFVLFDAGHRVPRSIARLFLSSLGRWGDIRHGANCAIASAHISDAAAHILFAQIVRAKYILVPLHARCLRKYFTTVRCPSTATLVWIGVGQALPCRVPNAVLDCRAASHECASAGVRRDDDDDDDDDDGLF
jgi:hypothetical protein